VLETHVIEPVQRGDHGHVVEVPAGAKRFQLILHVDLEPTNSPWSVEVAHRDGSMVLAGEAPSSAQGYLFLFCARADFPDGRYVARVRAKEGAELEYRFRLRSAAVREE
jgi:hypothetical protein